MDISVPSRRQQLATRVGCLVCCAVVLAASPAWGQFGRGHDPGRPPMGPGFGTYSTSPPPQEAGYSSRPPGPPPPAPRMASEDRYSSSVVPQSWNPPASGPMLQGPPPEHMPPPYQMGSVLRQEGPPMPHGGAEVVPPGQAVPHGHGNPPQIVQPYEEFLLHEYELHPDFPPHKSQPPKRPTATDLGMGGIYLPFAPFEIDHAKPGNYMMLRYEAFSNWRQPDRLEYLWARSGGLGVVGIPGLGPQFIETSINMQEYHLYMETGGDKLSAFVDVPLRAVDPEFNSNTTGLSDMYAGAKIVLYEEAGMTLTNIFTTYIPIGLASRGLGTGHVSLEPGLLFNYQASCTTYFHGEVKYWIPLPGNIEFIGQFLRYGVGVGHLLYERPNSDFALTSTLEVVGWSIFDGRAGVPGGGFVDVGSEALLHIYPGMRILFSETMEVGVSSGFALTSQRWYDGMFRMDFRIYF